MHKRKPALGIDALRAELKRRYPGIVFRAFHIEDNAYNLFWTDGPAQQQIKKLLAIYTGLDVTTHRRYSKALILKAIKAVQTNLHISRHISVADFQSGGLVGMKVPGAKRWSIDNNVQQRIAVTLTRLAG